MGCVVDVWLYGALARYGGDAARPSYANIKVQLPDGGTVADLLAQLGLPSGERGITFINGQLSAMPGLQPDLGHLLHDGDRIGLFDLRSMWPFQYRHGAAMIPEMASAVHGKEGIRHSYERRPRKEAS
ncbi:MAG: MoaD/ThiS family protein [Anaerolineae bacterium]|nr:MoaD/ThiS family protein [Anaerolineae bacterium]